LYDTSGHDIIVVFGGIGPHPIEDRDMAFIKRIVQQIVIRRQCSAVQDQYELGVFLDAIAAA
jgi:hypothetical protein